jgi:serine/threonine-protein kinase
VYRLIGRLEQGELADLFRAERAQSRERVVIKLFHPRTTDAAYAKVVADMARALRPLEHQRIAHVLEVGLVQQRLAIVREDVGRYSLGLVLQRLNTREVVLPPALALTFVLELLEVLGAAHEQGVVHGALTPGNVLVGDDGRPSLAEFGALAALQASEVLRTTFAGRGRTSYRAPELKTAAALPTVAADVYAVGAMTYELLTLREASMGNAAMSTRGERLPPPSRLVRRLHARIDPVIMRALEPTPGRRHRSCAEFADGLRDFLSSQGGIPPREELGKFVGELFPNEVAATHLGPVPFEAPFSLEPLEDVAPIEAAPIEVRERAPFSGGEVDARTPTSDGLPVFEPDAEVETAAEKTQPGVPAVAPARTPTWEAPKGPMPVAHAQDEGASPDVMKRRVRSLEAFDEPDGKPVEPRRQPLKREQEAKRTIVTFAVPFKRDGDPEVPDLAKMLARSKRQARVVSIIGTIVLTATIMGMGVGWYRSTPNPRATFISYLPVPIQRELDLKLQPGPPPGPAPINKVVLPIFPEPKPLPVQPVDTPSKPKKESCYDAPDKGRTAQFTVSSKRKVRVEIDGVLLCGSAASVVVSAGRHTVRFVDGSDSQTMVHDFKSGTSEKLVPFKAPHK